MDETWVLTQDRDLHSFSLCRRRDLQVSGVGRVRSELVYQCLCVGSMVDTYSILISNCTLIIVPRESMKPLHSFSVPTDSYSDTRSLLVVVD